MDNLLAIAEDLDPYYECPLCGSYNTQITNEALWARKKGRQLYLFEVDSEIYPWLNCKTCNKLTLHRNRRDYEDRRAK